ncbi:hypothetical protein C6P61_08615 [Malikia spinosa]|uniref:Uncharacterized protein n=1 Tax=Malikia spinosa TaxID=86180 RepID=A0A2S9KEL1_9BURK|nr:hypothetical protein C6P61_08615 [Malikia spinosa]
MLKKWLYKFSSVVFALTLVTYVLTLITVSYVGVYLTYVAVPVIIIFGVLTYFLAPKEVDSMVQKTPNKRILEIDARLKELGD